MYNVHHTQGFILSLVDTGEANRIYTIYSKGFGKVSVFAKGVRLEKSKLRCHLNPYSLIRFSFIEGKDFLRLTDAEELFAVPLNEDTFYLLGRGGTFLERMLSGQEKDEALWNALMSGFRYIYSTNTTPQFFESLFKARVLHHLGYVSLPSGILGEVIMKDDWSGVNLLDTDHKNLETIYSDSLTASQL